MVDANTFLEQVDSSGEIKPRNLFDDVNPAFEKALQILNQTDCTRSTIKRKLSRYEFDEKDIEGALLRLEEMGYIDDLRYATSYIQNELYFKARGIEVARMKLRSLGVSNDVIANAEASVDIEQADATAREFVSQRMQRALDALPDGADRSTIYKAKQKVVNAALRRGLEMRHVNECLKS